MLALIKEKWKFITAITLGICLVVLGVLYFFLRDSGSATTTTATVAAEKGTIKVTVTANGSLEHIANRGIAAKGSGAIKKINFQNGQLVHKGDLLFELDPTNLQRDIESARLDLRQMDMDLNTLLKQRQDLQVVAPISGTITAVPVTKNQEVSKNAAIASIEDNSKLKLKVPYNEAQVAYIKVGQKAEVFVESLFSKIAGKVTAVDRVGKPELDGSKLYKVTVEIPNPGSLAIGLEAQVDIYAGGGIQQSLETGTLEPIDTYEVRAGVSGTLEQLNIEVDSHVVKGQKLALISSDTLEDQIKSQQIKIQQSRLKLSSLEEQLADYKVAAPFEGVVNLLQMENPDINSSSSSSGSSSSSTTVGIGLNYWQVGDEVKAGQELAAIIGGSGMIVTVPVDEVDIAKVKIGQQAKITIDALTDKSYKGTVSDIAATGTVSNNVANFDVTLTIEQADELKAGMTANVEILVEQKDDVILLPIEAVSERQGKKFVSIADAAEGSKNSNGKTAQGGNRPAQNGSNDRSNSASSSSSNGAASRQGNLRQVETGLYNETMIEITSGIIVGERVVLPTVTRSSSTNGNNAMRIPGIGNNRTGGGMPGGFGR